MYISSLLSKTCSGGIVFGEFNQMKPCTFNNLTIFNAFSYLCHVVADIVGVPSGSSIVNTHEIVT